MKKKVIFWVLVSAAIMLLLPWTTFTFVKADAGMAVCFLLFFAVNPVYSVLLGISAGKNVRYLWSLPLISSMLFLLGAWIFFDAGETAFLIYAGIYLALGMAAMLISVLVRRKISE